MRKLSGRVTKAIIGLLVLAIVVGGGYYAFFRSSSTNTVTAQFTSAVGVYVGTPVKILGVNVGDVTEVKPGPQYVTVKMEYDSNYHIRAKDATAQEVANSLVSDRYINLGTLIDHDDTAATLKSGAVIQNDHTSSPAELDDIYAQLDRLSVALGPEGANKGGQSSGALSALLKVSAANLSGNGAAIGNSITRLAAAAKTLSDRSGGLFQTVKNLQTFTSALKESDGQVRLFNSQLAQVAGDLAAERTDLGAALQQLGIALNSVSTFVKNNQTKFHNDLQGLKTITGILVKQKASVNEALAIAPTALANITHAYYPQYGAIGTRSNLASLTDLGTNPTALVCDALSNLTGSIPSVGNLISTTCKGVTGATKTGSSSSSTALDPGTLIGSGK